MSSKKDLMWQGAQHLHLLTCFNSMSQEIVRTLKKSIHWLFDYFVTIAQITQDLL